MTCDSDWAIAWFVFQFLAIIIFAFVNMRTLNHIVKHLFMKILIMMTCSTLFHAPAVSRRARISARDTRRR
jgi:hypothetical protein